MSFSPAWLALREPADHAARSQELLRHVAQHFAAQKNLQVVDLGCGAGSNLRGTFAHLPANQNWRLVDYDPALLKAARGRLTAFADRAQSAGDRLAIEKGGKRLDVSFMQADLNGPLDAILAPKPDLVTAAALFDLVSAEWIARFVARLAADRLPLYTVLSYDGTDIWSPPHAHDAAMVSAFHAHQGGDKGFGPAAGPKASRLMAEAFRAHGYRVLTAQSPWQLDARQASLVSELAKGFAGAVSETGRVPQDDIGQWLSARLGGAEVTVGHEDLFAFPE